jgi:hypothetical protein
MAAATLTATVGDSLPGSVRLAVAADPNLPGTLVRRDGALPAQPVRNFTGTGSGVAVVIDCEAPLGRPVSYALLGEDGTVLATSGFVTCPAPGNGYSLVRSVLAPQVVWGWWEPADETGVEWPSSTTPFPVVGSDTPIVVSEVRQRHTGVLSFYCKSIGEADRLVSLMRDGTAVLVRHSPCAAKQTRDLLMYPLDVREQRWGRSGGRLVAVAYQSSKFVLGDTITPPDAWNFAALRDSAPTFADQAALFATFGDMALNRPKVRR